MGNKAILTQGGDGTVIPAGMVGETITFPNRAVDTTAVGAGAWARNTSKLATLTKGIWVIHAQCSHIVTATANNWRYAVSTSTGATPGAGVICASGSDASYNTSSANEVSFYMSPSGAISITSDTDIFAWAYGEDASGALFTGISGFAIRIV
jgi:hypothetical protein